MYCGDQESLVKKITLEFKHTTDRIRGSGCGCWAGPDEKREGETENHEQRAGLQFAGAEPRHHSLESLQLLEQSLVLTLQSLDPLSQLGVGVGAGVHPFLQPLHILLLLPPTLLGRQLVLYLTTNSLQMFLLSLSGKAEVKREMKVGRGSDLCERHVCW